MQPDKYLFVEPGREVDRRQLPIEGQQGEVDDFGWGADEEDVVGNCKRRDFRMVARGFTEDSSQRNTEQGLGQRVALSDALRRLKDSNDGVAPAHDVHR